MADCLSIYPGRSILADLGARWASALRPRFASGGDAGICLPALPTANPAGGALAVPMWIHVSRSLAASLPNLQASAESGAVHALRRHYKAPIIGDDVMDTTRQVTRRVAELTARDLKLFQKLNAAGWLSTGQIQRNFFSGKSANAVCKRLRKLSAAGFIAMSRLSSTESALYRLSGKGKLALVEHSSLKESDITIPTQLPRKIQHFTATNDLRFYFEELSQAEDITTLFFFSERELEQFSQRLGSNSDIILSLLARHRTRPDAIARIRRPRRQAGASDETDLALEYDAGTEQASFFGRTKVRHYSALALEAYRYAGDFKVLTFASSIKRIVSLMRQTVRYQAPRHLFYFTRINSLKEKEWQGAEIFLDPDDFFVAVGNRDCPRIVERELRGGVIPKHALVNLPAMSPRGLSSGEDRKG